MKATGLAINFVLLIFLLMWNTPAQAASKKRSDKRRWACPEFVNSNFGLLKRDGIKDLSYSCGHYRVDDSQIAEISQNKGFLVPYLLVTNNKFLPVLVVSQGGPGVSSIDFLVNIISVYPDLIKKFQLLAVDQRSTKYGHPKLDQTEFYINSPLSNKNIKCLQGFQPLTLERQSKCLEDKFSNVNLSSIHSYEMAGDIVTVAQALGYSKFNFYGVSYGTLLGQMLLKEYPENLEKVILDGVLLAGKNTLKWNLDVIARKVLGDCFHSQNCTTRELFLKRSEDIKQYSQKLHNKPVNYLSDNFWKIDKFGDRELAAFLLESIHDFKYESDDFFIDQHLTSLFEDIDRVSQLPEGNSSSTIVNFWYSLFQKDLEAGEKSLSGMYYSVVCREIVNQPEIYGSRKQKIPFIESLFPNVPREELLNMVEVISNSYSQNCKYFNFLKPHPKTLQNSVSTDIPVFLIGGSEDFQTPASNMVEAAKYMSQATIEVFEGLDHGVFSGSKEVYSKVIDFLLKN